MSVSMTPYLAKTISPEWQLSQLMTDDALFTLGPKIFDKFPPAFQIRPLTDLVAIYAYEHNPRLTNWYTSLRCIKKLPTQVPPLPQNIIPFLYQDCPKRICSQVKRNGTPYTIGEKCTLTLIPKDLSLSKLSNAIFYNLEEGPSISTYTDIKFHSFPPQASVKYADTLNPETEWQLQTDAVLEGSTDKTYKEQLKLLDALSQETSVQWKTPELLGTSTATFLKATITPKTTDNIDYKSTRLQENTQTGQLTISSSTTAPNVFGVFVLNDNHLDHHRIGMKALLKLKA